MSWDGSFSASSEFISKSHRQAHSWLFGSVHILLMWTGLVGGGRYLGTECRDAQAYRHAQAYLSLRCVLMVNCMW